MTLTHKEYALECERNGNLKENYVFVARERDRLREKNEELRRQVRHGKWIEECDEYYKMMYSKGFCPETIDYLTEWDIACSVCGEVFNKCDNNVEQFDYCPHCGAKMEWGWREMLDKVVFPSKTPIHSDIKLEPCPFCGSIPTMQRDTRYPQERDGEPVTAYEVVCKNHGCIIYDVDDHYCLSAEDAAGWWNRRAEI